MALKKKGSSKKKGSEKASSAPEPMYPNPPAPPGSSPKEPSGRVAFSAPPTMGARSDMPPTIQRSPQFKIGLTDQEQREEGKARLKAQDPGTSEAYGRSLYRPGANPPRSRSGNTLDRPARDYQ